MLSKFDFGVKEEGKRKEEWDLSSGLFEDQFVEYERGIKEE